MDGYQVSREFYIKMFGFRVVFDSGWYVQLEAPDGSNHQIGIVERDHHTVPVEFRTDPAGVILSIEVDDVDAVHERVTATGCAIALSLRDEDFGQRHFMAIDPSGPLVDVITPIPPSDDYAELYSNSTGTHD